MIRFRLGSGIEFQTRYFMLISFEAHYCSAYMKGIQCVFLTDDSFDFHTHTISHYKHLKRRSGINKEGDSFPYLVSFHHLF